MYSHAMNYWEVKKVEYLDLLVKMLLEALPCGLLAYLTI